MSKYMDEAGLAHFWAKLKELLDGKSSTDHKHSYNDLENKPTIPTVTLISWTESDMT